MAMQVNLERLVESAEHYLATGRYKQALAVYNAIIAGIKSNPFLFKRRGFTHRLLCDMDRAIADFSQAIRLDPGDAVSYWERGACRSQKLSLASGVTAAERQAALAEIIEDYKASVARDPTSAEAWLAIVEAQMMMRNWDGAISGYGACQAYIKSDALKLVRAWLGCIALIFAGEIIEAEDRAPLADTAIRLKSTDWCVSEMDGLLRDLEMEESYKDVFRAAKGIHFHFLGHFDEPPIGSRN